MSRTDEGTIEVRITTWWTVLFLLVSVVAVGQPELGSGVISGQVTNGSLGDMAVADQEVELHKYINEKEDATFRIAVVTDVKGSFSLEGLDVGDSLMYQPFVVYLGVEYAGTPVMLLPSNFRKKSKIPIFETTTSDSAISVAMYHMIVEPSHGFLNVREVIYFSNTGRYTYVGSVPAGPGKNAVLRLEFPENARELQVEGDLMSCCLVQDRNLIFDTMPFKPGSRTAVASYLLSHKGDDATLTRTVAYPTENLDIFLYDSHLEELTVSQGSENNTPELINHSGEPEPFEIRGKQYSRYDVGSLERGQALALKISNLTAPPSDFRWLAPVVLVSIIVFGYLSNRRRRRLENSNMARNAKETSQLTTEMGKADQPNSH